MKRILSRSQLQKFKICLVIFGVWFTGAIVQSAIAQDSESRTYSWKGETFSLFNRQTFSTGEIVEYSNKEAICTSWLLAPGISLLGDVTLGIAYAFVLIYLFLGIAIISDIFMGSIEVITSQTKEVTYQDGNGEKHTVSVTVWNPTIANLTLMALGSSAPEILLSLMETVMTIGSTPGELGPSTIVGSAAFNLLVISAVSIISVPVGEIKKVDDMGVFAITSMWSLFAYIWLYICLSIWTPEVITIEESVITLVFFILLIVSAFMADKYNERKKKKQASAEGVTEHQPHEAFNFQDFQHILAMQQSQHDMSEKDVKKKETLDKFLSDHFGTTDLNEIDMQELKEKLQPKSVVSRIAYRKQLGNAIAGRRDFVVIKGMKHVQEEMLASEKHQSHELNPSVGFKCLHYSVTESAGVLKVPIVKKVEETVTIGVRTVDDTAISGEDYRGMDKIITITSGSNEQQVEVEIIDDDQWEPDEDFLIEIYDPETKARLPGMDTQTRVTIIDDDEPGILSFQDRSAKVRAKDKKAYVKVLRQNGCDGIVKCKFETQNAQNQEQDHIAAAYEDYLPISGLLVFQHGETEKEIEIEILERKELDEADRDQLFQVKIFDPEGGVKISKKDICEVEIVGDSEQVQKMKGIEQILEMMKQQEEKTWCSQFKTGCMLAPMIDEDGNVDDISGLEAFLHFGSIFWKVFFGLVPPARMWGGWASFIMSLVMIGIIVIVVGEYATLFGCVLGLKPAVTAITFVALGTSLPDTFASKQAAQESSNADSAIGNVTGSNSVNVFLGLGLPWIIASVYYKVNGHHNNSVGAYEVPAGTLGFSVVLFLATSTCCLITLVIRRKVVGGELGGYSKCGNYGSAIFLVSLWVMYVLFSALQAYGHIAGF